MKTDGEIKFNGSVVETKEEIKDFKTKTSMVFQDPYSSLNPRQTVAQIITEPMQVHKIGQNKSCAVIDGVSDDVSIRFTVTIINVEK